MKISIYKTAIMSLMIIFTQTSNAEGLCENGADIIINNFEPYESALPNSEIVKLERLATRVKQLKKKGKQFSSIRIVGHAAKYGNSDFQSTSLNRAKVVLNELESSFQNKSIDPSKFRISTKGVSINCPVATNATTAGREKNRRVEIFLGQIKKKGKSKKGKSKKEANGSANKMTKFDSLLNHVVKTSDSQATVCMAKKLKNKDVDSKYFTVQGINEALNEPMNKKTFYNFRKYKSDLLGLAKSARTRFSKVPTKESNKTRFAKFMERRRSELLRTISLVGSSADCYDKRVVAIRSDMLRLSKGRDSFYSCKVVREEVNRMLDSLGGNPRGCSKF